MDHTGILRAPKYRLGSRTLLILSWILFVFGFGWTVTATVWALQTWGFVAKAAASSGVVTGNVFQGKLGCPQVRFRTRTDNGHVFTDQSACSNPPQYPVNAIVSVI